MLKNMRKRTIESKERGKVEQVGLKTERVKVKNKDDNGLVKQLTDRAAIKRDSLCIRIKSNIVGSGTSTSRLPLISKSEKIAKILIQQRTYLQNNNLRQFVGLQSTSAL